MDSGQTITATYRVVTPMFLGGANPEQAEFRLPSFKGALRFWWRALAWGRFDGDLEEIRNQETQLFGSTRQQAGLILKSSFVDSSPSIIEPGSPLPYAGDGIHYFGFGLFEFETDRLQKAYIEPGFEFELSIRTRPDSGVSKADLHHLCEALRIMGIWGGLGNRSQRGLGSLQLLKVNGDEQFDKLHRDGLRKLIKPYCRGVGSTLPSYTALSDHTRAYLFESDKEPIQLLEETLDSLRELVEDSGSAGNNLPIRVGFGLPRKFKKGTSPVGPNRRASPIFVSAKQPKYGNSAVCLLFLPAQFLPSDSQEIRVGNDHHTVNSADLWTAVSNTLDKLVDKMQASSSSRHVSSHRMPATGGTSAEHVWP